MSKKESLTLMALILCFTLFLTGCGSTTPKANMPAGETPTTLTTYPLTINDDSGGSVTLAAQPKRIISLVPSATETLFALGSGDTVVSVTKWDNYPVDVQKEVEYVFEDSIRPNSEQILELEPDLIVMGLMDNQKDIEAIRNLKIPVVTINPQTLAETYQTIEMFGKLTNTQEQAHQIVSGMKEKEQVIVEKIKTI